MSAPEVLDLCCGAFGAGEGYRRAGYAVTGWDIKKRRDLPPGVTFHKGDALDVLRDLDYVRTFDLIHASWPCQTLTRCTHLRDARGHRRAGYTHLIGSYVLNSARAAA